MKNGTRLSKPNRGVLLVLVLALLLGTAAGAAGIVFARYTNSQHAQRTIAPYDLGGARFSSNYLNSGNSRDNVQVIYVTSPAIQPSRAVTVCNYQQNDRMRIHDSDIVYDLTARLVRYDAGTVDKYVPVDAAYLSANSLTAYTIDVKKGNDAVITLGNTVVQTVYEDCTLAAGRAVSDAFSIKFSVDFAENQPNLYLELIAVPDDGALPTLRGIFKTGIRAEGLSNNWTGAFTDGTENAPNDYDGFNYTVSGIGSGVFTLKWDDTKVELSDVSIRELLSIAGATRSGSSITFAVNSDTAASYELQFYKVNVSGMTWVNMNEALDAAGDSLTSGKAVGYHFSIS